MLDFYYDSDIDGVVFWSDMMLNNFNLKNSPYRRLSFTKDYLFSSHLVFYFRKNSPLRDLFNKKLRILIESDLIQVWISSIVDKYKVKVKNRKQTTFHIKNIFGILQVCGVLYVISFIIFVLEMISARYLSIQHIVEYFTY